jgi:uncharacterized protein (TIGR02246 family)
MGLSYSLQEQSMMIPKSSYFSIVRALALVAFASLFFTCPLQAAEKPKDAAPPAVDVKPAAKAGEAPKAATAKIAPDTAIRLTAKAFVEAFNRGDANALAAMFTTGASVADDEGEVLRGQTAIRDEYARLFKAYPGAKIHVAVKSVEFPTPEMAIEDGVSQVSAEHAGPPVISRYTACHVLINGKWLMASVREAKIAVASNHSRVESLAWLVGTWKAERDGMEVESKIHWFANKSFLEREYNVSDDGIVISSGRQIIGWDPKAGKIRSWSFDASGGYGTGLWTATADGWQIETTGVLADGTPTSSRDILIRVPGENNVLGWKSIGRSRGEVSLPDAPEVVLDRIVGKK